MSHPRDNLILRTDSYKASHFLQYPPGTTRLLGYFESRGGLYGETVFFGLQYVLEEYLSRRITTPVLKLTRAADEVARGEYDVDVPEGGAGEIGELAHSFRGMASRLAESIEVSEAASALVFISISRSEIDWPAERATSTADEARASESVTAA